MAEKGNEFLADEILPEDRIKFRGIEVDENEHTVTFKYDGVRKSGSYIKVRDMFFIKWKKKGEEK